MLVTARRFTSLLCYSIGNLRNFYFKNLKNNSSKFIVKSENLAIGYFKLGFNSFDVNKKYRASQSTKNQYHSQFIVNVSTYWNSMYLVFHSKSVAFFHQFLKHKKIKGNLFPAAKINRLDLNNLRPIQASQESLIVDCFKRSEETIRAKAMNTLINSTKTDLKIASKRNDSSTKIYDISRKTH